VGRVCDFGLVGVKCEERTDQPALDFKRWATIALCLSIGHEIEAFVPKGSSWARSLVSQRESSRGQAEAKR